MGSLPKASASPTADTTNDGKLTRAVGKIQYYVHRTACIPRVKSAETLNRGLQASHRSIQALCTVDRETLTLISVLDMNCIVWVMGNHELNAIQDRYVRDSRTRHCRSLPTMVGTSVHIRKYKYILHHMVQRLWSSKGKECPGDYHYLQSKLGTFSIKSPNHCTQVGMNMEFILITSPMYNTL